MAGGAPAEVVPRRWQAALRGHAPQQLLGADGGTLLQEVRVAPAHSAGPLPARPPSAFLLRSVGAAWVSEPGLVCAMGTTEVRAGTGPEKLLAALQLQQSLDAGEEEMGDCGSDVSAP